MNTVQLAKSFAASYVCSVLMIGSKLVISNRQSKRVLVPGFKDMTEESARIQLKNAVKTLKLNRIVSDTPVVIEDDGSYVDDEEQDYVASMFGIGT